LQTQILININIICLKDFLINLIKRVFTIDSCNIIVLVIYTLSKNYINCIATTNYFTIIFAYFVAKVSIKIKSFYLFNNRDFFF